MGGEGTRPDSDLGSRVCTFRASSMQLQDNGKGGRRRNFRLPGDSSSQVHLRTLNLPLNGSPWCCGLDSLENVNGCWVWGGNVTRLYALLVLCVFSRVYHDVSYCDNHVCSQGPMII